MDSRCMRLSSPSTSVVNRVCCSPCPFLHPWKSTPKTAQLLTASWFTYEFSWFSIPLHNQTLVAPYVTTILLKKHITDVTRFNINTLAQKSLSHSLFLSYQLPFLLLHTSHDFTQFPNWLDKFFESRVFQNHFIAFPVTSQLRHY